MPRGPRHSIEVANERYVLTALTQARRNNSGIKEITLRANRLLREEQSRRRLTEDQVQKVLISLEAQGKASKWSEDPAIWGINAKGRASL